jgi:hypothetical protein
MFTEAFDFATPVSANSDYNTSLALCTNLHKGSSAPTGGLPVGMPYKLSSPYGDVWVAQGRDTGLLHKRKPNPISRIIVK